MWVCGSYHVHHFVGTELCCAPSPCVVHHWPALCTIVSKGDLKLQSFLCTLQVGDAQCRSMVHNIALYRWSGAQHRSHKPTHTHRRDHFHYLAADAGAKTRKQKGYNFICTCNVSCVVDTQNIHYSNTKLNTVHSNSRNTSGAQGPPLVLDYLHCAHNYRLCSREKIHLVASVWPLRLSCSNSLTLIISQCSVSL